jgi:hypothetical protein
VRLLDWDRERDRERAALEGQQVAVHHVVVRAEPLRIDAEFAASLAMDTRMSIHSTTITPLALLTTRWQRALEVVAVWLGAVGRLI